MSAPRTLILPVLAVALVTLGCGGGGGGSATPYGGGGGGGGATPPQNHVWVGNNNSMNFNPANIHVAPGTTVTWDFFSTHTVTSTTAGTAFDSGTLSTGTYTRNFPTAGTYTYVCTIHGAMMSGTVTVETGGTGY